MSSVFAGLALLAATGLFLYAETDQVHIVTQGAGDVAAWPRWRGPSGQGWVEGTGYPDKWSATENILWKSEVPGSGNSSPIIWGDRIFLTTSYAGGKRRSVLGFDRSNGNKLWETFVPDKDPESSHRKNGHASATPTTDGKAVYAYLGNHGVVAVDFQGKVLWSRALGSFDAYHGTASSPLLYDNLLIILQDSQNGSFIMALDKGTGKTVWRRDRNARVGWTTPVVVHVAGHDELIVSGQQQVTAYNPATGAELWYARGNTFEAIPTPVVGHGLIFCSSGRAGPTLAIRPGGSGDVTRTHIAWRASKGSPFVPAPVLHGDYLYMVNDMSAIATCYNAKTGDVMWQGRLGRAQREGFSGSPVVVNDKVFFTNDNGQTFALAAGPEFKLLHVNDLNERTLASPALVDGKWYFRTDEYLVAIGRK